MRNNAYLLMCIDWTEPSTLSVLITCSILLAALITLSIIFIYNRYRSKKFDVLLKDQSNSIRIFKIDLASETVIYFSRSNLKRKILLTLEQFYEQFYFEDRERLREWIEDLLSDDKRKDAPMYLEADINISKSHKTNYSLLKVISLNKELKTIHIESHILRYTLPKNKTKTTRGFISDVEMMNKYFIQNKPSGTTFVIRFYIDEQSNDSKDKMNRVIFAQLKDQIFPFTTSKSYRNLIEIDESSAALIDTRLNKQADVRVLARSLSHAILQFVTLNSLTSRIDFSIGVIENKTFPSDLEKILQKGLEIALVAKDKRQLISFYDENSDEDKISNVYSQEINQIIKDKNISYRYRPILEVETNKILGYFSYARPIHSVFNTALEVREYAQTSGQQKAVFSIIARNTLTKFIAMHNEDSNRLFFECYFQDKEQIFNVIKHINRIKEIRLVLLFDEKDLSHFSSNAIKQMMLEFKDENWEVALSLSGHELLLSSDIYKLFDYFIVGANFNQEFMRYPSKVRMSFQSTIEKLLRYKKPIIATNLIGWNTIELMIKFGIRYISSDDIANSDEMILPIDQRKLHKIETIKIS